jgi:hypothetical protein
VFLFLLAMVASQNLHDLGPDFCPGLIPLESHKVEQFLFWARIRLCGIHTLVLDPMVVGILGDEDHLFLRADFDLHCFFEIGMCNAICY